MTSTRIIRAIVLAAMALLLCPGLSVAQEKPGSHDNPPAIAPEVPSPLSKEDETLYLPAVIEEGQVTATGQDGLRPDPLSWKVSLSRIGLDFAESKLFTIPERARVTNTRINLSVDCGRLRKGQLGSTLIKDQENSRVSKRCGTNKKFEVAWTGLPVYTGDILEFYSRVVAAFANWEVTDPVSLTIDGSRITLRFNSGAQRISIIRKKVIRCRQHGRTERCVTSGGHFPVDWFPPARNR